MIQAADAASPLRIAIVGSGPSGFYAAEALLDSHPDVEIDMLERLPVPFGLVRHGVAPDHPKLKSVTTVFTETARRRGFRFFGNVELGTDVTVQQLDRMYHAVIVAVGADRDQPLGIPGEGLDGVHAASDFVAWYNGRPGSAGRRFDFSHRSAVVVGQGNVAIDVCRMLATSVDALRSTDIARHALEALAESRVREIHLVGRRGPAQAKFTPKELRELGSLPGWQLVLDPATLTLDEVSQAESLDAARPFVAKNLQILKTFASRPRTEERTIHLHFQRAPVLAEGGDRLQAVTLALQRLQGPVGEQRAVPTGDVERIEAGLLFRSVGYRASALPGLPFDDRRGVIPNVHGRVVDERGAPVRRWYVSGWIKRGATGIIGTNRQCSVETVQSVIDDLPKLVGHRPGRTALQKLMDERDHRVVSFDDWLVIDEAERTNGRLAGKVAEKFVDVAPMLHAMQIGRRERVPC